MTNNIQKLGLFAATLTLGCSVINVLIEIGKRQKLEIASAKLT